VREPPAPGATVGDTRRSATEIARSTPEPDALDDEFLETGMPDVFDPDRLNGGF
jgi:hypothetical protein